MKVSKQKYDTMVQAASPRSPKLKDSLCAFLVGGLICCVGQAAGDLYTMWGLSEEQVKMAVPVTLVFLSVLFTALGWYQKLAKHAGAGTLVPITGFANAVASPAIEFKAEGHILGIGAKVFSIAGPVLAFGFTASVAYGLIYWIFTSFF